jgi:UDP-N-acetylglucosamine 1-carboxyvinyltransferase
MDYLEIHGGATLAGEVKISGAKNATLPLIAATLLTDETVHLRGVPHRLVDVQTMTRLLVGLGCEATQRSGGRFDLTTPEIEQSTASYDLVRTMRASVLVLGPLLARHGEAHVSLPGGCAIGARPVDQHLRAMERLGAKIQLEGGYVIAQAPKGGLKGGTIVFDMVTVGGTENALMAAVLAKGTSIIENAAREPEIVELADLLIAMGAQIEGAGTSVIRVQGVSSLHGCTHTVRPDRIEAGTMLCAAAATGGDVHLDRCPTRALDSLIAKLREAGCKIKIDGEGDYPSVRIKGPNRPNAVDVTTAAHPGFPTDMQAQFMAVMAVAKGRSVIQETIFENRFMHAPELQRLGADIVVHGNQAVVRGTSKLSGAPVTASDLRASASLVIAALVAEGETTLRRIYHLDRGYELLERKLQRLGAKIHRRHG